MIQSQSSAPIPDLGAYRPLYTQEEWNEIYQKPTPATSFHYLIARNEKPEQTRTLIQIVQKDRIHQLLAIDPEHCDLTPLHIAAMKADDLVVAALTKKLAEQGKLQEALNARDTFGWTPLHHALLSSEQVFKRLQELGANMQARTALGDDCHDLQKYVGRVREQRSKAHIHLNIPGLAAKTLGELSAEQMKTTLGIDCYTDIVLYPPEHYRILWGHVPSDKPDDRYLAKAYEEWKANPPELMVAECEELKGKNQRFLGLYAKGNGIRAGTVLGVYSGVFDPRTTPQFYSFSDHFTHPETHKSYSLGGNNCEHVGNAMRTANCGWPNSFVIELKDGTERFLLIAGEPIKNEVLWCYGIGMSPLVFGAQVLLGAEEMRDFFKPGLTRIIQRQHQLSEAPQDTIPKIAEVYLYKERSLYPLHCPGALLDLHFRSIVPVQEWWELLKNPDKHEIIGSYIQRVRTLGLAMLCVIKRVLDFEKRFASNNKIRNEIAAWVLRSIGTLTIMQILKGLQKLGDDFEKGNLQSVEMEQHLTDLASWLAAEYKEWIQDPEAPVNLSFQKQVYAESLQHLNQEDVLSTLIVEIAKLKSENLPDSSEAIQLFLSYLKVLATRYKNIDQYIRSFLKKIYGGNPTEEYFEWFMKNIKETPSH